MPNRAAWEPHYPVGHATLDAQHQGLLTQCNHLADLCEAREGEVDDLKFDAAFAQLKALARAHFETESTLLAGDPNPDPERLEDHRAECDEFDYLVGEIVTADNFSRLELQRFLTLWFVGHIAGAAPGLRAVLAGAEPAA